jgi:hypothetical protein
MMRQRKSRGYMDIPPPGKTAPLQVKLSDAPSANVLVTVAWQSGSPALSIQGAATLTFTPANWNTYQTVLIAATPDRNDMNATAVFDLSAPGQIGEQVIAIKTETGGFSPILIIALGKRIWRILQVSAGMGKHSKTRNIHNWLGYPRTRPPHNWA